MQNIIFLSIEIVCPAYSVIFLQVTSDPTGFANQTATGIADTSDQTAEPAEDSANETQSSGQDVCNVAS